MNAPKNIEDHLREKMPPLRKDFRHALRAKLFHQASRQLNVSSSFDSIFTFLFTTMKRYSLVYLSVLVIGVFTLTTFLKTPLTAQEVLANTLENYEGTGDIYHEKIAYYHSNNEPDYIQENYLDPKGTALYLTKNIETEALESVNLQIVDSLVDTKMYVSSSNVAMAEPIISSDVDEAKIEKAESDYSKWIETFKGDKIYCVENFEKNELPAKAFMLIASDDHSVYQLGGTNDPRETQKEKDLNKMLSLTGSPQESKESIRDFIQNLAQDKLYDYHLINEEGKPYHLFKISYNGETEEGDFYWFYIDAQNFDLSRYEHYSGNKMTMKAVVLESEYLNSEDYPNLFNPDRFEDLVELEAYDLNADPVREFKSNGCYDSNLNKINDDFFLKLPAQTRQAWETHLVEMKADPIPQQDFEDLRGQLDFDYKKASLPTQSKITQLYHGGHYAWDFAPMEGEDDSIYVPFDGIVTSIETGEYNGGYGDAIGITHEIEGKRIETFYAHLDKIYVSPGQELKAGEKIGTMGATGFVTGKSLHFEVRIEGKKVDPSTLWQ